MAKFLAWTLFALGVAHTAYGIARFRGPLAAAVSAGFVGKFKEPEQRRLAFWFVICGPMIVLAGHVAVHAVAVGDFPLVRLVGIYLFAISSIAVAAFPKSPFLIPLVLSPFIVAVGSGWL